MPVNPTPEGTTPEATATAALSLHRRDDNPADAGATARAHLGSTATYRERFATIARAANLAGLYEVPDPLPAGANITPERHRILVERAAGFSYREMTERLHLSMGTVKNHVLNLHRIFGVHSSPELAIACWRYGILPVPDGIALLPGARPGTEVPEDAPEDVESTEDEGTDHRAEVVRVSARKWEVRVSGEVVATYRTKREAEAWEGTY